MSRKLFVANFPFTTTVDELQSLFGAHGNVVYAKIATDHETGRSRGFGFIEMETAEQAEAAIRELDGYQLGSRPLAVRVAEDRPGRGPGGPGGGPRGPRPPRQDAGGFGERSPYGRGPGGGGGGGYGERSPYGRGPGGGGGGGYGERRGPGGPGGYPPRGPRGPRSM